MTNTSTLPISSLDDERLIREGNTAAIAYAKSARENILPIARGLVAARRKYRSDTEFGRWFDQSAYRVVVTNYNMRAAYIYIGEHDEVAAPIIAKSQTIDPVAIASAIKTSIGLVSQNVKPAEIVHPAEIQQEEATVTLAEQTAISNPSRTAKRNPPAACCRRVW